MDLNEKLEALEKQHAALGAEIERLKSSLVAEEWPKRANRYSYVYSHGETGTAVWNDDIYDCGRKESGNVFRTQKEAEARADLLRWMTPALWRKIAVLREMMEFADEKGKVDIRLDVNGDLQVVNTNTWKTAGPHFASEASAYECVAAIGEERLKRDWFGVTECPRGDPQRG